jgi:hypothetical protein
MDKAYATAEPYPRPPPDFDWKRYRYTGSNK